MSRRKPRTFEEMKALEPEVARAHWRRALADLSKRWRPLHVVWLDDSTVRLVHDAENYDELNMPALRQSMPLEHYLIVRDLLRHIEEQAQAAITAAQVAREAIGTQTQRSTGGKATADRNKDEAAKRDVDLLKKAMQIRKVNPRHSIKSIAGLLADRGNGGKEAIYRKLLDLMPKAKKTM